MIGENEDLFVKSLLCDRVNFMAIPELKGEMRFLAKIRYNHQGAVCTVCPAGEDRVKVTFDEPQRAVTPGQAVVFYQGEYVAGGGIILEPA